MHSETAALTILHVATGVFFLTTGARKCFIPGVRQQVCNLFDSHGVPKPVQFMVIGGEFFGGIALLLGFLTQFASAGLLVIMAGAYLLDTWPNVHSEARAARWTWHKLLSKALCTPEAQLIVVLLGLLFMGAGRISLDYALRLP